MPDSQPFRLPDFYLPWPGRLNPNVETTRDHTRAWAGAMGMLDGTIWDEATFDAADFGMLSAYCYPDAPGRVLDLITDWYVWGFYFDDWFLRRYKRAHDTTGAIDYLERMLLFMPMDNGQHVPDAVDTVQRALAELWSQTVPLMSLAWRHRFADSTFAQMRDALWELENQSDQRVPNPVEYLEIRRGTGGGRWAADFVELAADAEIPDAVARTRPLRVLRDTIGDAAYLRNDIFSYQREIEVDGDVNNFVLVAQRFLGLSAQEAADTTNDLITSRMQQFDNTVLTELAALFEEHRLNAGQRMSILRYVKGLQDWQAGCHEWHARSSRYMNDETHESTQSYGFWPGPRGLGTAAARLWSTYRPVERDVDDYFLPDFETSDQVQPNQHLADANAAAVQWARDMGMLDGPVWDENSFASKEFTLWAAMTHPDVPLPRLVMVTKWHVWRFYLIDVVQAMFKRPRNLLGAKAFQSRIASYLSGGAATPPPTNPAERALNNLWHAIAVELPADARRRFPRHVRDLAEGLFWEVANLVQQRVPDPIDYMEMRRQSSGSGLSLELVRYAQESDLPEQAECLPRNQAAGELFADISSWRQDMLTYPDKIGVDGEVSNGVLGLQRFLGCDAQQAASVCGDLVSARVRQLELIPADSEQHARHLRGLHHWLAGDLEWNQIRRRDNADPNPILAYAGGAKP